MYHNPEAVALFDTVANDELARILEAYKAKHTTANRKPTTKPGRPKRFKHIYIKAHNLSYAIGIEYTFIGACVALEPGMTPRMLENMAGKYAEAMKPLFGAKASQRKLPLLHTAMDPGCVESPSKKLRTRRQLRKLSKSMHEIASELGMQGHTEYHGGGGAHIHIGARRKSDMHVMDNPAVQHMLLDAMHRPYIQWAFTNPGDTENTSILSGLALQAYNQHSSSRNQKPTREQLQTAVDDAMRYVADCREQYVHYAEVYRKDINASYPSRKPAWRRARQQTTLCGDEGYSLRHGFRQLIKARKALAAWVEPAHGPQPFITREQALGYMRDAMGKKYGITPRNEKGTVEFRMFQAPNRWQDHEKHADFALAYLEWSEAQAKAGYMPAPYVYPIKAVVNDAWSGAMQAQPDHAAFAAYWTLERCKREFLRFCGTIGLTPSHYKPFLKRLETRFKLAEVNKSLLRPLFM